MLYLIDTVSECISCSGQSVVFLCVFTRQVLMDKTVRGRHNSLSEGETS